MSPFVASSLAWLRHHLRWSNSWQSWKERLGILLLLAGAAWAFTAGTRLSGVQQVLLWGLLLVAAAVLLRRGWLKLFGPVLFYDLVRLARRGRYPLIRGLYTVFLLLMLWSVYASNSPAWQGTLQPRQLADLAAAFFGTFMGVQIAAVVLLTPAYTAGAIAEEKERKTLEFLLATDLHNREIVLSKQISRLANLTLLVLAGLPILSFMQLLGGVDPDLVLAGFAATGMTMLGLGSLSILCSVYAKRARNAIVLTYLAMMAYLAISLGLLLLVNVYPGVGSWSLALGDTVISVQDVVDALNAGDPLVGLGKLEVSLVRQRSYGDVLPGLLREYALFYAVVTLGCTVWAVLRLRAVALRQTLGTVKKPWRLSRRKDRPYLGDQPIVWKEVRLEPGLQMNWFGRIALALLMVVSFIPPVLIAWEFIQDQWLRGRTSRWLEFGQAINIWVRVAGTMVACLIVLGVAVRAAGSISGERDRQTWDSLMTSLLDSNDILFGKWVGAITGVRWGWAWLGLIWGLGVVTGGLHLLAVPLLVGACLVYASFVAILGLWFSVVSRSTLRANVWTLFTAAGVAVGHWLPWMTCCLPLELFRGGDGLEHVAEFQGFGLTPPVTLGWLAFFGEEFGAGGDQKAGTYTVMALVGLALWAVAAGVLWGITSQRFRDVTRRQPIRPPAPPRPPQPVPPAPVAGDGPPPTG